MGVQENEKALRYIGQLDEARCTARWTDVPELARKIEKHAPHRRCLALTARSEARIGTYSAQRPSTAASTSSANLSKIIPPLLTAIEEEAEYPQDAFQATICLGWLHFVLDEPGLAVARLPKDLSTAILKLSGNSHALGNWTHVCIVKGAYIKGFSQEKTSAVQDALKTYSSVFPFLLSLSSLTSTSAQFRLWTERLLGRACLLVDQSSSEIHDIDSAQSLKAFRIWQRLWDSLAASGASGSEAGKSRRLVWKAYYDTLSTLLQRGHSYEPSPTNLEPRQYDSSEKLEQYLNSRLQQRSELKRVEAIYEGLILKETHFPKASENNYEIEQWIEAVMSNWRVLCGPNWQDEELGEGGKGAVGRGVLDILYRAATKTFHSTQILRHLFTVHASLAEFDLSFKAYDSYVEIVTRGKDRAEKSGEDEASMDDDDTILRTAAEAIRMLCRFGSRDEAVKALHIGQNIDKWLKQHTPSISFLNPTPTDKDVAKESEEPTKYQLHPRTLAVAYRAIGISQAHWALWTYEASSRTKLQKQAIHYLRKSLEPKFEDPHNLETLYALGLALAETRDITGALKIVKRALSPATKLDISIRTDGVISDKPLSTTAPFLRERKLIPLWHLLSLLLASRSDFSTAAKTCEAAFEQFENPVNLFGKGEGSKEYRSDHLNAKEKHTKKSRAIVDQMETYEKVGIIEIKMTQLSLLEVLENSNVAVDESDELLGLYARLFGDPSEDQVKRHLHTASPAPPMSSAGTFKGSIFRSRSTRKNAEAGAAVAKEPSETNSRPSTVATQRTAATQATAAPTIQVTDENGSEKANGHRHKLHFKPDLRHNHDSDKSAPKRGGSVKLQKRSAGSLRRQSQADEDKTNEKYELDGAPNGKPHRNNSQREKSTHRPSMSSSIRKSTETPERPLQPVAHNAPNTVQPPPVGHAKQPPQQDNRLPAPFPHPNYTPPDPRFSILQERRQKVSLLVKVWLFISGLYTRSAMYEDAKGAIREAAKLVQGLEYEVAQESSSAKAFANQGWGGGKGVEELWADTWASQGEMLQAQDSPHEARIEYEKALSHFPDHPTAIVGLSNILLDIFGQVIPPEPTPISGLTSPLTSPSVPAISTTEVDTKKTHIISAAPSAENQVSAPELYRLAARDRAHGLLSTLTKLGPGWDYSEAWLALARAYEECGQIEKAKEVLWWCVELEDSHPVREWSSVGVGKFVL
ncbi:filamentation protein-like protein [Lophium mytilinum]|uniref:Filamentation protein-like protein n=1 Tax=Lophium mytilinum TaxID=390894 RepID=A0A6A6QEK7_9PEZI|nr:filamentation protein-like protein [Lophium mytilinum]